MDEKYIVQFVTLLGAAVTSIFLAIRVYNNQTDIVRALIILLCVIIVFYVIGKFVRKTMMKIRASIEEKERALFENKEEVEESEDSDESEEKAGEDGDSLTQ